MTDSTQQGPLHPILQTAQQQFITLRHARSAPLLKTAGNPSTSRHLWFAAPIAAALILALTLTLPGRQAPPSGSFGDRPQLDPYSALERGANGLSRWGHGFGSSLAEQSTAVSEHPGRLTGLSIPPRPRLSSGFAPHGDEVS